jgi:hypothetical protein
MARADLRKAESDAAWLAIGQAMDRARQACQLTVKEFAGLVDRDPRQVARWFDGTERPQVDAVFAVTMLRQALLVALAAAAGPGVEIETVVRIRTAGGAR